MHCSYVSSVDVEKVTAGCVNIPVTKLEAGKHEGAK